MIKTDRYNELEQELIKEVVNKHVDALGLVDRIVELHKKIDEQSKEISLLREDTKIYNKYRKNDDGEEDYNE